MKIIIPLTVKRKGGAGSGNWGHAGRPGMVGGSGGKTGTGAAMSIASGRTAAQRQEEARSRGMKKLGVMGYIEGGKRNLQAQSFLDKDPKTGVVDERHMSLNLEERGELKNEIINNLADSTGVSHDDVNNFVGQWAVSSNDTDMRSLAIQQDAAKEFDIELSDWQKGEIGDAMASFIKDARNPLMPSDTQRALLRSMYDTTQQAFAKQGLGPNDTVRLYRGMLGVEELHTQLGDVIPYHGNAMESWTANIGTARAFGVDASSPTGALLVADVPIKNIVSTSRTGSGCIIESEYTIFGTVPGSQVRIGAVGMHRDDIPARYREAGFQIEPSEYSETVVFAAEKSIKSTIDELV